MASQSKLRIAIVGGGVASLCLAHGLTRQHPHWDVKIFEASPGKRDEGAALGLSDNSQEALRLISPSIRKALDEAGGIPCDPPPSLVMGTGPHAGLRLGEVQTGTTAITVHRTSFWNALHKLIPGDVLQMGKRLTTIKTSPETGTVHLTFEDGSTYQADALVGADGLNSTVRSHVLGADHPAVKPVYQKGYDLWIVVPTSEAEQVFGKEYCSTKTQIGYVGDHGYLMTDFSEDGNSMQIVADFQNEEEWAYDVPWVEWDKERVKQDLKGWGWIGEAMLKLFLAQPTLGAICFRTHLSTPTYAKGPVCLVGDAAEAFAPAQGAGAGQAIEDALFLSTVLGVCTERSQIPLAFETYDAVRRPRRSAIAKTSAICHKILTGRDIEVGLDPEKILPKIIEMRKTISPVDLEGMQRKGLDMMKKGGVAAANGNGVQH